MIKNLPSFSTKICLLFFLLWSHYSFSQNQRIVTGRIVSSDGDTIPGASVVEVGTFNGSVSNMDGTYSLKVSEKATKLEFSSIGYVKQQIEIGSNTLINVVLKTDRKSVV